MFQAYRHIPALAIISAYLCGLFMPIVEVSSAQPEANGTLLLKNNCDKSTPITRTVPVKPQQRFVKAKDVFSYSPFLSEKANPEPNIHASTIVRTLGQERACLFLLYTSLSDRAPPLL